MSLLTNATDLAIEEDLKQFLVILLVALSAASLPKIFTALRQIPYTLLLVIVGLGLALVDVRLVDLSPGMILLILLPPILYEAAWKTKWTDLRSEIVPSSLFAVGGVLISIAGIGWALHQWMAVPWTTSLLTGACLAATDSASVLGVFRQVGAGKRLTTLLEGESLLNDGTSVVAFGVLLGLAVTAQTVQVSQTVLQFFIVSGIGVGVGGVIGVCVALLTQRYELSWVEQSLTLVTAYGTYLLVEELGGSGVIGVVTVGLVIGNFSTIPGKEPPKRTTVVEFWEFVTFFVNSIVFLLLGDQLLLPRFIENINTNMIAIFAVIASRAIAVYCLSAVSGWLTQNPISLPDQTVLWWAGLRGSVSIALALSIPATVADREQMISNSFAVVLFTLIVQGLTTKPLLAKLNLLQDQSLLQTYLELIARRDALQQVSHYLSQIKENAAIATDLHQKQTEFVGQQLQQFQQDIQFMQTQYPQLQAFNIQQHQEKLLAIETETYSKFVQSGLLKSLPDGLMQKTFDSY